MRIYTNVHVPGNLRKTYEITKMLIQKDIFLKKTWIDLEFVSSYCEVVVNSKVQEMHDENCRVHTRQ